MIATGFTGDHHPAFMNTDLHCDTSNKETITPMAKLSSLIARKTNPFLHCDPPRQSNTSVAPLRVFREKPGSLNKQDRNSF
jgi:hypothetical protein